MTKQVSEVPDDFGVVATQEQLETVAQLAKEQIRLEVEIEKAETTLKEFRQQLARIQQSALPDALYAAGLSEFKTLEGHKISIKEDIAVSIPKDRKDAIIEWLENNGHAEVVTGTVYVELPKNSHNEKIAAIEALVEAGLEPVEDVTVHTSTLKAILKTHLKKGDNINLEDFGAYAWKKAEIKRK